MVDFIQIHPDQAVVFYADLDEGDIIEDSMLWTMLQGTCVSIPASARFVVTSRDRPFENLEQLSTTFIINSRLLAGNCCGFFEEGRCGEFVTVMKNIDEGAGKVFLKEVEGYPSRLAGLMAHRAMLQNACVRTVPRIQAAAKDEDRHLHETGGSPSSVMRHKAWQTGAF